MGLRHRTRVAALLLVSACGYPERRFVREEAEAWCALLATCGYLADPEACVDEVGDPRPDAGCAYDPESAAGCVDAWAAAACDTEYPSVCDAVYTECP